VVWLTRVAWSRPDPLVLDVEDVLEVVNPVVLGVPPDVCSHHLVQVLSKGLSQAICKYFQHDLRVVVVLLLEASHHLLYLEPC